MLTYVEDSVASVSVGVPARLCEEFLSFFGSIFLGELHFWPDEVESGNMARNSTPIFCTSDFGGVIDTIGVKNQNDSGIFFDTP